MKSYNEQRLARFVDRETEMRSFCRMLEDADWHRPVMLVWGDGGIGKTSLLMRMIHECSLRSLRKAEVIWTDTRNHDYLSVMRKIRDDIGATRFPEFTNLVNFFTDPHSTQHFKVAIDSGAISVGAGASMGPAAHVGTMAGILIKDSMFIATRPDLAISEDERMARLTDQFILDLNAASANEKFVLFLDALDKATETTQRWVWEELIRALCDGRLGNVRFVIGGRSQPSLDERWRSFVDEKQLGPLKREHVFEYLIKRGIESKEAGVAADWVLAFSAGHPLKVASAVEAMFRMREQEDRLQ
jgi:GTPase SAR1 family protein